MPILEVELVTGPGEALPPDLAPRLAEAAAAAMSQPPGRTWVRLRMLPAGHYAEDGGGPPAGVRPVFVSVLKARRPAADALAEEAARLAAALAAVCGRPVENVHILYEEAAAGRIAFGGDLVQ